MEVVSLAGIPQLARNWGRVVEIIGVLAKYGLADWIAKIDLRLVNQLLKQTAMQPLTDATQEVRVRLALTELGTTFIKLGQMLSTRRDVIGAALADALADLQSNVPADPFDKTKAIVQDELKKPLGELFATFEPVPIASASIGQAHKATLADGRAVVVKVQHPGITEKIQTDLSILAELAKLAEKYVSELRPYTPTAVVAEFGKQLSRELDFRRELRHLQIFTRNFAENADVHFPQPYPHLSSVRVLTMEFLDGEQLSTRAAALASSESGTQLAHRGARVFLDMIFRDGFFHADPHPGNVLIAADGRIGLLDAGMVGRVDDKLRGLIERGMMAVLNKDSAALTDLVMQVGKVPPDLDVSDLQSEVADQMTFYWGMPLDQFRLAAAMDELTEAVRRYQIVLPASVSLLIKVLVMLEGTGRRLDPNFNLAGLLEAYKKPFMKRTMSPKKMFARLFAGLQDWNDVLGGMPRMARDLMRFAREQRFAVQLQHQHLEPSVNRLVFGLIVCALLLGSMFMWALKAPPVMWEISVPGVIGMIGSGLLSVRLYWAIQKAGKLED